MKLLATAAAVLSLSFAGHAVAASAPVPLTESQLDAVVAGTGNNDGHHGRRDRRCGCGGGGISFLNGSMNGNYILSGNQVNVLSGNNLAVGVGILGVGANASYGKGGHGHHGGY